MMRGSSGVLGFPEQVVAAPTDALERRARWVAGQDDTEVQLVRRCR
jgi:hypothetical protein